MNRKVEATNRTKTTQQPVSPTEKLREEGKKY